MVEKLDLLVLIFVNSFGWGSCLGGVVGGKNYWSIFFAFIISVTHMVSLLLFFQFLTFTSDQTASASELDNLPIFVICPNLDKFLILAVAGGSLSHATVALAHSASELSMGLGSKQFQHQL